MASLSSDDLTLHAFQDRLDTSDVFEIDFFDFPDADNSVALKTHLSLRRRKAAKGPLHVVLVGRPFSALNAPSVFDPATKTFTVEAADGTKSEVDLKTFGAAHIKEGFGQPRDAEHEQWLFEINVARFRAMLRTAGFADDEYVFYDGGIAQHAGISFKPHVQEWKFAVDADKDVMQVSTLSGAVRLASAAELQEFKATWFGWSREARLDYFKACRNAIPKELRHTEPLLKKGKKKGEENEHEEEGNDAKKQRTAETAPSLVDLAEQGATFRVYSGAPLVELPEVVKPRVEYVAAMFGALNGSKNVLGENFNTVTAFENALKLAAGEYPNARVLLFPTEALKNVNAVFTVDAATLAGLVEGSEALALASGVVQQWTDLNPRGETQPLFDVPIFMKPVTCAEQFKIFKTNPVVRRTNLLAAGTPFEECGLSITPSGETNTKTWLTPESAFPVGVYCVDAYGLTYGLDGAEGGNFEPSARATFLAFLRDAFSASK